MHGPVLVNHGEHLPPQTAFGIETNNQDADMRHLSYLGADSSQAGGVAGFLQHKDAFE